MLSISEIIEKINGGGFTTTPIQKKVWADLDKQLKVHSKGYFYDKIRAIRPHETDKSLNNRLLQFEPITTDPYNRAKTMVKRILNTSFKFTATNTDAFMSMVQESDVKQAFKDDMIDWLIDEPNSFIVIYPKEVLESEKWKSKVKKVINYVKHENIVYLDDDAIAYICDEDSEIEIKYTSRCADVELRPINGLNAEQSIISATHEEAKSYLKKVFHIITKDGIYVYTEKNETSTHFKYDFFVKPYRQFGGESVYKHIYKSFFHRCVPWGNYALDRMSDDIAVKSRYSFPIPIFNDLPTCATCNGSGSVKLYSDIDNSYIGEETCGSCRGSGYTVSFSPLEGLANKKAENITESNGTGRKMVEFAHPDTPILNFSHESWQFFLERMEDSLCIYKRRKGADAETAESIERQLIPQIDFITEINMQYYNLYSFVLNILYYYATKSQNANEYPRLEAPKNVMIHTEQEMQDTLIRLMDSKSSPFIRREGTLKYLQKTVGFESDIYKKIEAASDEDPYFWYNFTEKMELLKNNVITADQMRNSNDVLHKVFKK